MKVQLARSTTKTEINILINNVCFGVFDILEGKEYSFFPRRQEQLTGEHYIAIGKALNEVNDPSELRNNKFRPIQKSNFIKSFKFNWSGFNKHKEFLRNSVDKAGEELQEHNIDSINISINNMIEQLQNVQTFIKENSQVPGRN
jgi:hypothetical protein